MAEIGKIGLVAIGFDGRCNGSVPHSLVIQITNPTDDRPTISSSATRMSQGWLQRFFIA